MRLILKANVRLSALMLMLTAGGASGLAQQTGFGGASPASQYFSDAAGWGQSSAYYDSIRLADVNGDGKPDLCGRGAAGIVCALGNGDGTFGASNVWTSDFSDAAGWGDPQYGTTIMFADINNDGLADVCGPGAAGIVCAFSADLHDGVGSAYNRIILRDHPVAFWQINLQANTEPDLSGTGNTRTYGLGVPGAVTMPSSPSLSISARHNLAR